jgi:3-oxoacyl-[acyl-carrier-protein] synthase II
MYNGFSGPSYSVATACSSSAYAIVQAAEMIKSGMIDAAIVGGADSIINPEEIKGFNEIFALSTENSNPEKASKPFSIDRDGFVIGEGAGMLVLENLEKAQDRNAKVLSELKGYALNNEAFNIVSPKTDGEGMADCMEKALKNSGVSADEISYINAHGTSTNLNDLYETLAIKKIFNDSKSIPPVSSTKSMIGHTIGAAGAIEAIVSVLSLQYGLLHPTINYTPDPELDLDFIAEGSRECKGNCVLSNSFGFGGHNASLVFGKI